MIPRELVMKPLLEVADFLGRNYPCGCANHPPDDCPGEICEAEEVVRMVLEAVAADIWDQGWVSRHADGEQYIVTPNPYRASEAA